MIFISTSLFVSNRVHCAHLLEETFSHQSKYNEEVQNNGDNIEAINETLSTLKQLFETSGCKTQMCTNLKEQLPSTVADFQTIDKAKYDTLVAAELVGCLGKKIAGST